MSKELEALEKIKNIKTISVPERRVTTFQEKYKVELELIEDTIKDHETLKKEYEFLSEHCNELLNESRKEHRVIEIIKNKQVDLSCLIFDGLELYNENMHPTRVITQEEYDLLKEVLL